MSLDDLIAADVQSVFLNTNDFAESVIFHLDSGDLPLVCLVELDEPIRDTSGFTSTVYTGRIRIAATDRSTLLPEGEPVLTATAKGYVWNITDIANPEDGMCNVGIQREIPEHSNAIDLQGNQHRYG